MLLKRCVWRLIGVVLYKLVWVVCRARHKCVNEVGAPPCPILANCAQSVKNDESIMT